MTEQNLINLTAVRVFFDATVSPAIMNDVQTSRKGLDWIGRILIVIPELDYGLIEQVRSGITTAEGTPASTYLEEIAIKRAESICREKAVREIMFLSRQSLNPELNTIRKSVKQTVEERKYDWLVAHVSLDGKIEFEKKE